MLQNASKVEKSVLIIHGDADIIALPNSSKLIMEKLASNNKNLKVFPWADHWALSKHYSNNEHKIYIREKNGSFYDSQKLA